MQNEADISDLGLLLSKLGSANLLGAGKSSSVSTLLNDPNLALTLFAPTNQGDCPLQPPQHRRILPLAKRG